MTLAADISQIWVKIDGAQASANLLADLLEVTVDHTLHLPSMFTIRVHAHDMTWLEDATLREGKKIDIYIGEKPAVKVLSGLIASLEPDLNVAAPALVVRGYALSHRLYRGRHRRSFLQVTDSDLVKKLAGEAGDSLELEALMLGGDEAVFGAEAAELKVAAELVEHVKGPKLRVNKFKPKRGYRRRAGHRQQLTRIRVTKIGK